MKMFSFSSTFPYQNNSKDNKMLEKQKICFSSIFEPSKPIVGVNRLEYKISVTHFKKTNNGVLTLPFNEKFGNNLQEYIFIYCTNVYAIFTVYHV